LAGLFAVWASTRAANFFKKFIHLIEPICGSGVRNKKGERQSRMNAIAARKESVFAASATVLGINK